MVTWQGLEDGDKDCLCKVSSFRSLKKFCLDFKYFYDVILNLLTVKFE